MKSRLFHHKDPRTASRTGAQSDTDTLSMLSVGAVTLTPEGEITEINARARDELRIRGGDFSHPLNISDILSVCHDRQDLLPGIFARLRERHRYGDLPPWSYIRLRNSNLKFYIEGRFVGRYDRRRQLRRIVFLFRNTEEEITRKFILGMALSQTKIFPWFFDLGHNRMVIDERWFAHLGLPAGDGTIGTEDFFRLVHPEDRGRLADAFAKQLAGEMNPDTFTYRLRRGDGTWEWFEEQSVYLGQTGDGSPYRIVGICQSIHAHKTSGRRTARSPRQGEGERPAEKRVSGQHEPRDTHAPQRHHRLRQPAHQRRHPVQRGGEAGVQPAHNEQRRPVAAPDFGHPRPFEDRIEHHGIPFRGALAARPADGYLSGSAALHAGRRPFAARHAAGGHTDSHRRVAAQAGRQQPHQQRREIHGRRQHHLRLPLPRRGAKRSNCSSTTPGRASHRSIWTGFSNGSTRPTRSSKASGSDCRSAARSPNIWAAPFRSSPNPAKAPGSRFSTR